MSKNDKKKIKQHPHDLQEKGQQYEEIGDQPAHKETGEFFLKRYHELDKSVTFIDIKTIRQALRINTLRTTAEILQQRLEERGAHLEKVSFLRNGFFASAPFSFGATPEYLLGQYYLQAPLSQFACEILNPASGATVLDMAAAPGGKTTYLATMIGDDGTIVALDIDQQRLAAVRNNVERLGITNVLCVKKDARFAADLKRKFHYVLLDAPCSGNYCSEEQWFGKRTMQDIKNNARTQRELVRAAYMCLETGGKLLYSTCSLEPEEDELIIDWALKKYPDLTVISLNIALGDNGTTVWNNEQLDPRLSGTKRFWPHKTVTEGFYIALLQKTA